ncbi:MAG: ParB/RepB/Spo0J family partition protein, partial [Polaromonas sp.]
EIVAGERRWLAAAIAGLDKVPFMLRELTDSEALDIQLIENLAREDLTPLEEGEAFAHRIEHGGLTAEQVGAKVGRSREYVYSKTKLLDLCLEAKEALRNEQIDASHALRIARIPDVKLQIKALEYATTVRPGSAGDKPSVTDFMRWLQQNVMLKLNSAVFKITDANLLADAGSCKDCMKRTGANPDIFSDVDGADICTDPPCFNKKSDAHRAAILSKAEAKGMRVIDGAEAKKVCSANSSALKGYSALSQQRMDVNDDSDNAPKLGKLLGKDAPDPVLIENPYTKELIEAVPTVEAEAVLLAKGLIKVTTDAKSKDDDLKHLTERLKAGLKRDCEKGARLAMYSALMEAIRATTDDKAAALVSPALLRVWLTDRVDELDHEDTADVLQVPYEKDNPTATSGDAPKLRLQACDDATVFRAMAIYLIQDERGIPYGSEAQPHLIFDAMASRTQLNLHAVRKDAEQAVKDDTAEKIRQLKAEHAAARKPAPKQPAPTTPLAQPKDTAPATASTGTKAKARGQKMSAEDAQSGIAQAMQGIEGKAAPAALQPVLAWPFPTEPVDKAKPSLKAEKAAGETTGRQGQGEAVSTGLRIGVRVEVGGPHVLRPAVARFAGLVGIVTAERNSKGEWEVKLDKNGRGGGVRMFTTGEIAA